MLMSHAARLLLPLVTCAAVLARADSETCAAEGEGACEAEATYPVAKTAFVLTSALGSVGESFKFQNEYPGGPADFAKDVYATFESRAQEAKVDLPTRKDENDFVDIGALNKQTADLYTSAFLDTAVDLIPYNRDWKQIEQRFGSKLYEYFRAHHDSTFVPTGVYEGFEGISGVIQQYLNFLTAEGGACKHATVQWGKNAAAKLEEGDDVRAYFAFQGCVGDKAFRDAEERIDRPLNVYAAVAEHILISHGAIPDRKRQPKKSAALNEELGGDGYGVVELFTLTAL